MNDLYVERMARTLVQYSLGLREGDRFLVQGSDLTAPLIREVYRAAVKAGAHPEVMVNLDGLSEIFFKEASEAQLDFVSPLRLNAFQTYDAFLAIRGEHNTRAHSGIDPQRQARRSQALGVINRTLMDRAAAGKVRWCATQYPTQADAQEASMSLGDYAAFVYEACRLTGDDPVAAWEEVHRHQEQIIEKISRIDLLHIVGEETDLKLRVGSRKWINCNGERNFPDGEIFTGPIEDSAQGVIRFSFPGVYGGKEIEDIRLRFEKGRVVKAEARRGEELLQALLATDAGASYLGEIGIGTNFQIERFSRNMLFDEKIGGTAHLAVGAGYPESGSSNRSAIHWDMLCDLRNGGEIYGDGRLIYREGSFLF